VSRLKIASARDRTEAVFAKDILVNHLPARDTGRRKRQTPDDEVAAILGGTLGRHDSAKFMRNATPRSEILPEVGWVADPGSMG